jgi:hypothetical protein
MHNSWRRRATVGGLGLALGLLLVVIIAVAPPKGTADSIERQTIERTAYDDVGAPRAARGIHPTPGTPEFPTPGTPKLTCLDD